ncbi:MAG: hypothetical protein LKJ76_01130 [Lachnospiraceae bacterium]|jgi:hypothetical protein|nr:hypothetical protein [Lachnospiraceae bacterium]
METYTMKWEKRKDFLKKSCLIGLIAGIIVSVLLIIVSGGIQTGKDIWEAVVFVVIMILFSIAATCVIRMMKNGSSEGFAIGALGSFWGMCLGAFSGGTFGFVAGFIMMIIYGLLFIAVACFYAIYLPVTSVYYYIRQKNEK